MSLLPSLSPDFSDINCNLTEPKHSCVRADDVVDIVLAFGNCHMNDFLPLHTLYIRSFFFMLSNNDFTEYEPCKIRQTNNNNIRCSFAQLNCLPGLSLRPIRSLYIMALYICYRPMTHISARSCMSDRVHLLLRHYVMCHIGSSQSLWL